MKLVHIGFLCALLLGGSELAAKGGFKRIYDEEVDPVQRRTRCIQHLQEKMVNQHKLNDANGEESAFQWNLYLFKQFIKLYTVNPQTMEEATGPESQYRAFRATSMFMLRTTEPLWEMRANSEFLQELAKTTALLRNMQNSGNSIFQLTQEQIESWIHAFRSGEPIQVKGSELKAKNSILQSWGIWIKKPEIQFVPPTSNLSIVEEEDPFAGIESPPTQRKAQ